VTNGRRLGEVHNDSAEILSEKGHSCLMMRLYSEKYVIVHSSKRTHFGMSEFAVVPISLFYVGGPAFRPSGIGARSAGRCPFS
jgi:hypothetical protein